MRIASGTAALLAAAVVGACGGGEQGTGGNQAPVANAGPDQDVSTGSSIALNGSGSFDPDGNPLTYTWSFTSRPAASGATLTGATTTSPTFTADRDGTYVVQLVVNDGTVSSPPDTVTIVANVAANVAPVADAGPDQSLATGSVVSLDGTGSFDGDGNPLTYGWSFTSRPAGSGATLAGSTTASPTFTADEDGTYVVQLVVNDGTVSSPPDTVTIVANVAPVADAGADQSLATGAVVSLDGTGSFDGDGNPLTYAWSFVSRPGASGATLAGATTASPTFTADEDGTYVVQLVVGDGRASSAPDTVTITAAPVNVAPVANAGADRNVSTGSTVTVSGSASSDANADPLTYAWSFAMKPAGSAATLSAPTAASPSFTADLDGPYLLVLVVNDGRLDSAAATVVVTAAPLGFVANGDGTVTDALTGLVWQSGENRSTRNWYEASGTYDPTYNPTSASICGEQTTGGHADWRLPTKKELVATVDHRRGAPAFDPTYFPMSGYDPYYASFFWTATSRGAPGAFRMGPTGTTTIVARTESQYYHYVRCVRGGPLPAPSFTNNGDGTVTDAGAGRMWQRCTAGRNADSTCSGTPTARTWRDALTYCDGLALAGHSDWRLPNVKELESIMDDARFAPTIDSTYFPNTTADAYWSATTVPGSPNAWYLDFYYGDLFGEDKSSAYRVRCVRSTPPSPPNAAPVANAGPDRNVAPGALVALDGTASSDANGDPLTYAWSFTSAPPGSGAALSSATSASPTFTADLAGAYVLTLVVDDGDASSAPDTVTLTAVAPLHVPDTGQTQAFGTSPGQDADHATNPPSYTDNGDGTVTDDVTHLVWQRQDDGAQRTWEAAAAYCAGLSLPGSGWRLPTPFELVTIQHFGRSSPAIDTAVFPGGRAAYYWSGYPFRSTTDAWIADFWDGGVLSVPQATPGYVRCVRGDALVSAFADEGNGTVADVARSLQWQQQDDGAKKTWEQALAYCEGLSLGGFADWRLPNVKELASLEDFAAYPVADLTFFPTTREDLYWSSTTVTSATATAWHASFLGGGVGLPGRDKTTAAAYVRCVRGQ